MKIVYNTFLTLRTCLVFSLSGTHDAPAPVNADGLAGDKAGLLAGQEPDHGRHLLHVTHPAQGVGRLAVLQEPHWIFYNWNCFLMRLTKNHFFIIDIEEVSQFHYYNVITLIM